MCRVFPKLLHINFDASKFPHSYLKMEKDLSVYLIAKILEIKKHWFLLWSIISYSNYLSPCRKFFWIKKTSLNGIPVGSDSFTQLSEVYLARGKCQRNFTWEAFWRSFMEGNCIFSCVNCLLTKLVSIMDYRN